MADKLVMGYWDCDQCGTKHIEGLKQACPNCGKVRSTSTRFYMDGKRYLSEEEARDKGNGEDWLCPFCNALNSNEDQTCRSCGADRQSSEMGYKAMKQKGDEKQAVKEAAVKKATSAPPRNGKKKLLLFVLAAVFVLIAAFAVWSQLPKSGSYTVDSLSWEYNIDIEKHVRIRESDWDLPKDAELIKKTTEIRSYRSVIDHYETKQESYQTQEIDGYDVEYDYVDNGDGTFREVSRQVPRYRTVWKTRTVQEPVYRQEPVYDTKYDYYIWRWQDERDVTTSGTDQNPYWGDPKLSELERESSREETYLVETTNKKGKAQSWETTRDIWDQLETGNSYEFTTKSGRILKLETQ